MELPRPPPWFSNGPSQYFYQGPWPQGPPERAFPRRPHYGGEPPFNNAYVAAPNYGAAAPELGLATGFARNMQVLETSVQRVLDNLKPDEPRTTFSVFRSALAGLGLPPNFPLGLTVNEIPSLSKLAAKEARVTMLMECYIAARNVITLHDLEREVLQVEGIHDYEDLGLGPLLEHPVVKEYFPHLPTVFRVTTSDILHHLSVYMMNQTGSKPVEQHNFLQYLGDMKSQPPQHLGVLIKDLRMYCEAVKRAQKMENSIIRKFAKQARVKASHTGEHPPSVIDRVSDFLRKEDASPAKKKGKSSPEDKPNKRRRLESQEFVPVAASHSSCPYPSAVEERNRIGRQRKMLCTGKKVAGDGLRLSDSELSTFARQLKKACKEETMHEVLSALLVAHGKKPVAKSFAKFPEIGLLNVAVLMQKAGFLEHIIPGSTSLKKESFKVESSRNSRHHEKTVSENGEPTLEVLLTTVLHDMGMFFTDKRVKKLSKVFNTDKKLGPSSWWTALTCICESLDRLKQRSPEDCAARFTGQWFIQFIYERWHLLPSQLTQALQSNFRAKSEVGLKVPHHRLCTFLQQSFFAAEDDEHFLAEVEERTRHQFHCTFEELSNSDLLSLKAGLEIGTSNSLVVYSGAVFPRVQGVELPLQVQKPEGSGQKTDCKVGVSVLDALHLLEGAPPLSDLAMWSQWNTLYRPSLGDLLEFVETGPGQGKFHVFVTLAGTLLRINKACTVETFLAALINGSSKEIAENLVSLVAIYGGVRHIPRILLQSYATKGVSLLIEGKRCSATVPLMEIDSVQSVAKAAGTCVLESLIRIPEELRVLAAEILLPALKEELGNELPSVFLQACKTDEHRSVLHGIGLSSGVVEWVNDFLSMHQSAPTELAGRSEPESGLSECCFLMGEVALESHPAVVRSQSCLAEGRSSGTFCLAGATDSKSTVSSPALIEKCQAIIESIRLVEFGLGQQRDASESSLLLKQHARMGRALRRLSQDLYSEDSHFVLELIQNADDNTYEPGVQPTIMFVLQHEHITVLNNEVGFTEANIRALCDVGTSTKAGQAGYIGQKGIGFKSVFRVTDAPEIHSNGFHIKFDILDGDIGCILPTCIKPASSFTSQITEACMLRDAAGGTCIRLPLKQSLQTSGLKKLFGDLDEVHPSLLLFLKKLRCIAVENQITGSTSILRREDLDNNLVNVIHSNGSTTSWVVAREQLHAVVPRPGKEVTELMLGFPVQEDPSGEYRAIFLNQKVFSYLPLRSYGLKFLVQADFLLTSSREDVDKDDPWNQWLLSQIPALFIKASNSIRGLAVEKSRGLSMTEYLAFVPAEGEVHGFFQALPRLILARLRASACLPVDGEAEHSIPSLLLRGWDDSVRAVISDKMLRKHLGLQYLDRDVTMTDSLASSLGVQMYGKETLISLMASISQQGGGLDLLGPRWIKAWMVLLHKHMGHGPQGFPMEGWKELNGVPFVPLSDGRYTTLGTGRLWFTSRDEGEDMFRHLPLLLAELRIIHPSLLEDGNEKDTDRDKVKQLLSIFGIYEISCHEVIKTHVLTTFKDSECLGKKPKLIVEYLACVMLHLQSDCQQCKADSFDFRMQLKKWAVILTNNGLKRIGSEPIHFSQMMGNPVEVKSFLRGTEVVWNEVDSSYVDVMRDGLKTSSLMQWRTFFKELGVTDFLKVKKVDADDGSNSPGWHCPELIAILEQLCQPNAEMKNKEQLAALISELDKHWHDSFSVCQQQYETAFIMQLRSLPCLTSSMTWNLQLPSLLYDRCTAVEDVVGPQAPYALPKITSTGLREALGLRTKVSVDDAINLLGQWHHLSPFVACTSQMERFYSLLWQTEGTEKEKVMVAMTSRPSIFLPLTMSSNLNEPLPGNFHCAQNIMWDDPTGALEALYTVHTLGSANSTELRIPLKKVYPTLWSFFIDELRVPKEPDFDGYLDVLMHISKCYSPYEMQKQVTGVFKALSQQLVSGCVEPSMLEHWRSCFQDKKYSVFPTHQGDWVSLSSCEGFVCLSDSVNLRQEIAASLDNVHFLLLGDDAVPGKGLDQDDRAVKTDVLPLLRALNVPLLSEAVGVEIVAQGKRDASRLRNVLLWSMQYMQRYLAKHRPQEYDGLQSGNIADRIKDLTCEVVDQLSYRHVLLCAKWSSAPKDSSCRFQVQECKLYVRAACADDFCTIYKEVSRFFLSGQADLQLANFCQIVTSMQQAGASEMDIENFVSRVQGIPPLKCGDPVWSISDACYPSGGMLICKPKLTLAPEGGDALSPFHGEAKSLEAADYVVQGDGQIARNDRKLRRHQAPNEHIQDLTGRSGEALVFRHLVQNHGVGKVTWVNEAAESGAAFDILVELEDGSNEFVEVKSTRSADKDWFEISAREWEFAHQKGDKYTIIRVQLGHKPRMLRMPNPVKLCQCKSLQLALILQDSLVSSCG